MVSTIPKKKQKKLNHYLYKQVMAVGGARGVMVIVVGIGHNDTSSNPGRDWLHFT